MKMLGVKCSEFETFLKTEVQNEVEINKIKVKENKYINKHFINNLLIFFENKRLCSFQK